MSRVRSPKSIGGVVELTLGNAPYGCGNSDRTIFFH
jgi:chorismate synthase